MKGLTVLILASLVLSGCSGKSGPEAVVEEVPDEINKQKLDDVTSELVSKFPRRFSFPGQEVLEPVVRFFNDTVSPGTGSASPEFPDDTGPVAVNPTYVRYDLSEEVPPGQPVEMRIKLKWWGNPGSAGDLDIFVDVPGTSDAHDPDSFDESNNWNIVTKFRVVNAVPIEGQPFDVGVQVSNGRVLVDDMPYSLRVDLEFAHDVLAPGIAYGVTIPQNASQLVFESQPLSGDEHITGEFMVIDPQDRLHRHILYDDIGVDGRAVSVFRTGEYVLFAPALRGGFLKVLTDVPNEHFQARILNMEERTAALASGVLPPVGTTGSFDVDSFPLQMHAWIEPSSPSPAGVAGQAALNITTEGSWIVTTAVSGSVSGEQFGRIGGHKVTGHEYSNLRIGTYDWTVEGSAAVAMNAGYAYWTYTR